MNKYIMSFLVGFIGMTVLMAVTGCSAARINPPRPAQCIHPAILGGMPFNLPEDARFTTTGHVVFKAPDGTGIDLVGIICIQVTDAAVQQ